MSVITSAPDVTTATAGPYAGSQQALAEPATTPSPTLGQTSASASAKVSTQRSWALGLRQVHAAARPSPVSTAHVGRGVLGDTEITSLKDKALTLLRRDRIGFIFQVFNLLRP
jgi:hypothetical protein